MSILYCMLKEDSSTLLPLGSDSQNTSSQTFTCLVILRLLSGVPDHPQKEKCTDTNIESLPTNSPLRSLYSETERRQSLTHMLRFPSACQNRPLLSNLVLFYLRENSQQNQKNATSRNLRLSRKKKHSVKIINIHREIREDIATLN